MKKYTSIGLTILGLTGVMVAMLLWARSFSASVYGYRSPLHESTLSPASTSLTATNRVVIVLISGLGYDDSERLTLPTLAQLRRIGANVAAQSVPPTYAQTSWAALISGAPPETNDAPPVNLPVDELRLLDVDTLFARAHESTLKTALLGLADWRRLIPRNQLDYTFFVDTPGPETDRSILEAALPLLKNNQVDLALLHFTQVDQAAQSGTAGPAYQQAAGQVDAYLAQIWAAINSEHTVLVVVSDYGHIPSGGHGGAEAEVIWQPVVMVGGAIVPGNYSDINQVDMTPTLAALLGVAPPGAAQGRLLLEMLRLKKEERVAAQLALAQQRVKLAQAYVTAVKGEAAALPDNLITDLARAQATLISGNADGAFQLAELVQQAADAQMMVVRSSRLRLERWLRLPLVALVIFIWLNLMWRRRGFHAGSILMAGIMTVALYHALYQLQGHSYSISSFGGDYWPDFAGLPLDIARRMAVSVLAGSGLLLVFFMLTQEQSGRVLLGAGYGFSALVTFMFMLPFWWGYWQNGLVPVWHLPAVEPLFWQVSGAFETLSAAALGLVLPWPVLSLSLLLNLARRRLSRPPAK